MSTIKALMIRNGQAVGAVDLYRDGEIVTLIAHGEAEQTTPFGNVRTRGVFEQQFDTVEAYEYVRDRVAKNPRFTLAYTKMIGRLGVDDDARRAPPLPNELRYLLPEHARALGDGTNGAGFNTTSGRPRETPGRPFLALARATESRRGER